jgi:PKD repeat protein
MKKIQLLFLFLFSASSLFAQWEQVNNGLPNTSVTSMFCWLDTLIIGTDGGGIFKSYDNGDNWIDINGNIGNKNINDIRGGGYYKAIWVSTDGGPFSTLDHVNYDNTGTGLTNTDINYYWLSGDNETDWAIGTNGGGLFTSQEPEGPWNASSTGLSGNGLIVNDVSGYSDDEDDHVDLATDDGVYYSTDNLATWTGIKNGLSGDALLVKRIASLGSAIFIVTRAGMYYSLELGDWVPLIPSEKFNTMTIIPTPIGDYSIFAFVAGEKCFFSFDLSNWTEDNLSGVTGGEITSVAWNNQNPSYVFIGTQTGGVYRKSIDNFTTTTTTELTAAFSASPTSGPVPLTVQFTDNSTVPGSKLNSLAKKILKNTASTSTVTTWEWDFDNDGTVDATEQNPSHTYQTPDDFTVSLTVSDGTNTDTMTKTDFISATQLTADFSATPVSGAPPLTVQFSDNSTALNTTISSWDWDFDNDGTVDATTQNPSHSYQNDGNYTVSLTVGDGSNTDNETKISYISVASGTQITAAFSGTPTTGLTPLSVQFTDNSIGSNTTITSWLWDFDNDGTVDARSQNPFYTYQNPGNYTVSLTVSDGTLSDVETKSNYISPIQLNADFAANPTTGSSPLAVQFTDNSVASNTVITSWSWDFDNDGTVDATTQNPSHTYQNDGNYTVSLKVNDGTYSDSETKTNYISVGQVATPLTAGFLATPTSGYAPLSVQFTDNSTASNLTITSWTWDFDNDGNIDAATQNPNYTYQMPGNYTVSLTVDDGVDTDVETKTDFISVSQLSAGFTATPTSGFAPLVVQFTDNSTASNTTITSWAWDFNNDGIEDAATQNPSYTYQNAGTYTVSLKVGDGIYSDKSIAYDIIKAALFDYPSEITVTTSYDFPTHSNIEDFQSTDYKIFGVPGNSNVYLQDFLSSAHKEKWQAYYDNGAAQNFLVEYTQSENFKLATGKAFWLLHNGSININSDVVVSPLDAANNAIISVNTGWNIITNPFATSIYWGDIQTENSIADPIYGYNNGFSVSDSLLSYTGYYYYNTNNLPEIKIPYYTSISNPLRKVTSEKHDFAMFVNLVKKNISVGKVLLGVNKDAQNGFDQFDYRKPRAVGKITDVQFFRPEWDENYCSFYSDIRGDIFNKEEWNFQVVNSIFKELSLTVDMYSNIQFPDSTLMTLVDWSNNRWIDLKDVSEYKFIGNANPMNFSIIVGQETELTNMLSTIVPTAYVLSQNFPNPFNNETIFTFSCPEQTKIEVVLFNAVGQKVRSLFSGMVFPGKNTFKWNGKNDQGISLSSGVYILSLTTASQQRFSKKIILMK